MGAVTDGGIRDLSGIRRNAPGFQIFAPGAVVSHGNGTMLELNVPVSICGLDIEPGDLLHGDESGLVKVPLEIAEAVAEQAQRVRDEEAEAFEYLHSDSVSLDGIKRQLWG